MLRNCQAQIDIIYAPFPFARFFRRPSQSVGLLWLRVFWCGPTNLWPCSSHLLRQMHDAKLVQALSKEGLCITCDDDEAKTIIPTTRIRILCV